MRKIIARAPAKLNLTFDIVGTLPGGYHEVATLYQAIDLEDELSFELSQSDQTQMQLVLTGVAAQADFPSDDSNLICLAARLFLGSLPEHPSISMKVAVEKNIPLGAGLAGGSGNAAATLVALNHFFNHRFGMEELLVLASKLGADVPFCLEGGSCIGRGRGDDLTVVKPSPKLFFLVIKPAQLSISTPWAYQTYDQFGGNEIRPDLEGAVNGLRSGDLESAAHSFGNAFEPAIFAHYPQLAELQKRLLDLGGWCCHLTGKGPTLYTLVPDREMAHAMRRRLMELSSPGTGKSESDGVNCFITESVPYGARLIDES